MKSKKPVKIKYEVIRKNKTLEEFAEDNDGEDID